MELAQKLSKELRVQPLKPGETAKFELLNRYKKENGREEPSCPDLWALSEKETIFDPFANDGMGKTIVISNVVSYLPTDLPSGETLDKPVLEKPTFVKGVIECTHEENGTYLYLMRSNGNINNPYRKKSARKKFRIINTKKEIYDALQDEDLRYHAEKLVRESGWDDRRAIAFALNKSADSRHHISGDIGNDTQGTLLQLIKLSKQYPRKVILSSNDIAAKNRVYISDAMAYQLLIWDNQHSAWSMYRPDQKNDKLVDLTTVDANKDKFEALLDYFRTEQGRNNYKLLVSALQKILKATA